VKENTTFTTAIAWLCVPKGRVSRWQYFSIHLGLVLIGLVLWGGIASIPTADGNAPFWADILAWVAIAYALFLCYATFMLVCKRLHDMNCSAWLAILFAILFFIPGINVIAALVLLFSPRQNLQGQSFNRYGADPRLPA
jgi:uncharacterized membrane protein YhaH (DUF805 family)